jgi:tripartite-type tricarboxylate transporter receptor subunit TctC
MTNQMNRRQWLATGAALASTALGSGRAFGQAGKTIRIVVPFAAGAGTDAVGRLLAQKFSELLATPVVVENRTGASGAIGTKHVAQSAPDGNTLLLVAAPFTTVAAALPASGYDPVRDFSPIGMVASGPLVWAVNKSLPVANLKELVEYARSKPAALNYGSAGDGGINHLVLEMLKNRAGVFITHIPYRGIAPATIDMIGGQIQMLTGTVPALAPYIRDGRVKAIAVTSSGRSPALPNVMGMSESGFSGFNVLNYFGLVAPQGTPNAVIERLNSTLNTVLAMPDVLSRFATDAVVATPGDPAQLAQFVAKDFSGWQQVVSAQKLKIQSA